MYRRSQNRGLEATPEEQRRHAEYVQKFREVEDLKESNWAKLGETEKPGELGVMEKWPENELAAKKAALQQAENKVAEIDGRPPAKVVFLYDKEWDQRLGKKEFTLKESENAKFATTINEKTGKTENYIILSQKCKDSAPECVRLMRHEQSHAQDVHANSKSRLGQLKSRSERLLPYHSRQSEIRANSRAFALQRELYPHHKVDPAKLTRSEKKGLDASMKFSRAGKDANHPVPTRRGKPPQPASSFRQRFQNVKQRVRKPSQAPPKPTARKANAPKPAPAPKVKAPKGPSK